MARSVLRDRARVPGTRKDAAGLSVQGSPFPVSKPGQRQVCERHRGMRVRVEYSTREPRVRIEEATFIVGRRGGKSKAVATLAAYLASLCDHRLVRGERGV